LGTSEPFQNGEVSVSDDGLWLFISTSAGVRIVSLLGSGPGAGQGFRFDVSALTVAGAIRHTPSVEPVLFRAEMPPTPTEMHKARDVVWQEVGRSEPRSEAAAEWADWLQNIEGPMLV